MLWVDVSPYLLHKARERWGDTGRPTIEDFAEGPLEAAVFFCERGFDALRPESEGSPIKLVILPETVLFPALVFFAMEVVSPRPNRRFVELLDYSADTHRG